MVAQISIIFSRNENECLLRTWRYKFPPAVPERDELVMRNKSNREIAPFLSVNFAQVTTECVESN
jgi:hypothetical protein